MPENRSTGFPTRSHTNRPVQSQKQALGLELRIYLEEFYYPCSENKGADQCAVTAQAQLICAFVFA